MTSPHAGAPTRPVPTFGSSLSRVPTFRGFSACSMTFSLYAIFRSSMRRPLDGLQIDALFVHFPKRRHLAKVLHLLRDEVGDPVDFLFRVETTETESDARV